MQGSTLTLPTDSGYTAHRDAEQRCRETREWLAKRERELGFTEAPLTAPEKRNAALN